MGTIADDIQTGLDLCDQITAAIEDGWFSTEAEDFVTGVQPKLESVQDYVNRNGYATEKQTTMIRNIVRGLENWVEALPE